jgi:hypothetical protein
VNGVVDELVVGNSVGLGQQAARLGLRAFVLVLGV